LTQLGVRGRVIRRQLLNLFQDLDRFFVTAKIQQGGGEPVMMGTASGPVRASDVQPRQPRSFLVPSACLPATGSIPGDMDLIHPCPSALHPPTFLL
jgi:hypothetical protein